MKHKNLSLHHYYHNQYLILQSKPDNSNKLARAVSSSWEERIAKIPKRKSNPYYKNQQIETY